jgi:hypothetical protein
MTLTLRAEARDSRSSAVTRVTLLWIRARASLGGWCLSRLGARKAREGPENRVGLSLANKDRGAAAVLSGGHFQAHQRRSFNTRHLGRRVLPQRADRPYGIWPLLPGRSGVLRDRPGAPRAAGTAGQHRVRCGQRRHGRAGGTRARPGRLLRYCREPARGHGARRSLGYNRPRAQPSAPPTRSPARPTPIRESSSPISQR